VGRQEKQRNGHVYGSRSGWETPVLDTLLDPLLEGGAGNRGGLQIDRNNLSARGNLQSEHEAPHERGSRLARRVIQVLESG
jgi:hypothetical protein